MTWEEYNNIKRYNNSIRRQLRKLSKDGRIARDYYLFCYVCYNEADNNMSIKLANELWEKYYLEKHPEAIKAAWPKFPNVPECGITELENIVFVFLDIIFARLTSRPDYIIINNWLYNNGIEVAFGEL